MAAGSSHPLLNYGLQKNSGVRQNCLLQYSVRTVVSRLHAVINGHLPRAVRVAQNLGEKRPPDGPPRAALSHTYAYMRLLMAVAERTARQPQPGAPEYLQSTPPGPVPAVSCGVLRRKLGRGLRRARDSRGTSQRMPPRCGRSRLPPRPGRRLTTRRWCARPASCPRPPGFPPAARGRCGCSTRTPSSRSGRPGRTTTACSARPRTP